MNVTRVGPVSSRQLSQALRRAVVVVVGLSGALFMYVIARLLMSGIMPTWRLWDDAEVNFTLTLQMLMLPLSFLAVLFVRLYEPNGFRTYFRLRTAENSDEAAAWRALGPVLALLFTAGTTMFMSVSVAAQGGEMNAIFLRLLPLVLLLAATNAWTEEIFTRFVIVAGLSGKLSPTAVCWTAALVFGLPHFFGTPSGVFGMVMAGLMGWMLAKSVIETRSMTWALSIHFLQDVVIFGGGAMVVAARG